jgi:hypothetical protein
MSDNSEILVSLTARETQVYDRVMAAYGQRGLTEASPEYRTIFADYAAIHREYVALAAGGDVEALKRALFLQWYRVTEPWYLCGLSDLDATAEHQAVRLIDERCASNRLDDELRWMLPYYYLITDYYFQYVGHCPALVTYCQAHPQRGLIKKPPGFVSQGRGQMGEYWESIFT